DNGNFDARVVARKELEKLNKNPSQYFYEKDIADNEKARRRAKSATNAAQHQMIQIQNQMRQQEIQIQNNQMQMQSKYSVNWFLCTHPLLI
ncbi:MAG: hypothetical protein WA151_01475, partial [Desulfatirhabdiaceae bacterium]